MSKPVRVEPEAQADIEEARDWYDGQRPGLGNDLLLCIEASLEAIGDRPKSFPKIHKRARRALVRRFPYRIVFVELKDVIAVIGVIHTRRDPGASLSRIESF